MDNALAFKCAALTHVGNVRSVNEDAILSRPNTGLWAVADGMGGHHAGDIASNMIVDNLAAILAPGSGREFLDVVKQRLQSVSQEIYALSQQDGSVTMGSTVVVFIVFENYFACLWVGDSRAYRLRGLDFDQLTRDHSVVQEMIDRGEVTEDEAIGHRLSNVITRAVGANEELAIDVCHESIETGDIYVLCSDGLTSFVSDNDIADILMQNDLESAADRLLKAALDGGGRDNISIILLQAVDGDFGPGDDQTIDFWK